MIFSNIAVRPARSDSARAQRGIRHPFRPNPFSAVDSDATFRKKEIEELVPWRVRCPRGLSVLSDFQLPKNKLIRRQLATIA